MVDVNKSSSLPRSTVNATKDGISSVMNANGVFIDAFVQASQAYMSRLSALSEELMGFAAGRIQKNSAMGESLMKCRDITDALRIQQDWMRATTEHYVQEAGRLFEITSHAALAGLKPLSEHGAHLQDEMRKAS